MSPLDRDTCRLVCACSLAAVNHGLVNHAETIRDALPHLVSDPADGRILEATLLIGLDRTAQALQLLRHDHSSAADTLRLLLQSRHRSAPANPPPASSCVLFG